MKPIAWSWSRLDCFEKCPKQFYEKNISKSVKFESSPAMERGKRLHDHMENALKGSPVNSEISHMKPIIDKLNAVLWDSKDVEIELAYRHDMSSTSWFGKDVWLRVKQDFVGVKGDRAISWDWKTGKKYGYTDQLKLYAGDVFHRYPAVETVDTAYVYMDTKDQELKTWRRADVDDIWRDFGERSELIQIANQNGHWPAKPSRMNCKWCPVTNCNAKMR